MSAIDALRSLFDEILREARTNARFADRLATALESRTPLGSGGPSRRRGGRRPAGALDPFALYQLGEEELRRRLQGLDIEQMKDIVAEHGMDSSKLAMKWKMPTRLIELIVNTVRARVEKGDAFRA